MAVLTNSSEQESSLLTKTTISLALLAIPSLIVGTFLFVFFTILLTEQSNPNNTEFVQETYTKSKGFPKEAEKYFPIYQAAGKKYGVPWNILAGIHKIETDFGRDLRDSSVGAHGHMQFMDKTWVGWSYPGGTRLGDLPNHVDITDPKLIAKYGGYGVDANHDGKADPNDPADAIFAAAKYLAANYQRSRSWYGKGGAIYAYNHDYTNYVLKVKQYAESFATVTAPVNGSVTATGQFMWPLSGGRITSPFGYRTHPLSGVRKMHTGVDVGAAMGTPIRAADGGIVERSSPSSGYGWLIVINHGNGYKTRYAHMYAKDVKVQQGQRVAKGQVIALVGSNGFSTGPHLHFELMRNETLIDPMSLVKKGE
jgi:murein DD-endopeptidase MepM/ murein hydrolase activator NlpD